MLARGWGWFEGINLVRGGFGWLGMGLVGME